jgi:hypothetical protein
MAEASSAVLSGSGAFTSALLSPLMTRYGAGLRVTSEPADALQFCRDRGGTLFVELQSDRWLPVFQELRQRHGENVRIVVAVPPARAGALDALRSVPVDLTFPSERGAAQALAALERIDAGEALAPPPAEAPAIPDGPSEAPAAEPSAGVPAVDASSGSAAADAAPDPFAAPPAAEPSPAEAPTAVAFVPSEIWPGTVPTADDAEHLVSSAVAGLKPEGDAPLDATLDALTASERAALCGDPVEGDPLLLRRAAALRYRVGVALAGEPAAGAPVDAPAGAALMAELDGVLAALRGADGGDLEVIRRALVKEAVDLSEALQRLTPVAVPVPAAVPAPRPAPPRAAAPRILSVTKQDDEEPARRRSVGLVVVLAISALAAGGYHAYRWRERHSVPPPATLPGAPAGSIGSASGKTKMLFAPPGLTLDPAELERFKAAEQAKGNRVIQAAPGTWIVTPAARPPAGGQEQR